MNGVRAALGWGVGLSVLGLVLLLRAVGAVADDASAWPWAALAAGIVLLAHPQARQEGSAGWPIVLTVVGGVVAIGELGGLPAGIPLVPVLLVAAGVALVVSATLGPRRGRAEEAVAVATEGATSARLVLAHGAGSLHLSGGAGEGLVCEGTAAGGARTVATRVGDRLEVTLRPPGDLEEVARLRRPLEWRLALPEGLPIDLEVRTGASEVRLELARTAVRSLRVGTGASDLDLEVPARGHTRVEVDAGAADVDVRVPQGTAASVRTRGALASVDVDERRFPRDGDRYRSVGFEEAAHRAEIELAGGVASFRVR